MKAIAQEIERLLEQHKQALHALPASTMEFKPGPQKWSRKEILGHLIDSAQNNLRRFIVAQYEDSPHIVYNQDKWVKMSNYQEWDNKDLLDLWWLTNRQIVAVLRDTPVEMETRTCLTGDLHTIQWLAADYIKHLRHHLHQVLDLENSPYP